MSCPATYDATTGMWRVDDPDQVRAVLLDPITFHPDNALTAHTRLSVRALRTLAEVGFALPPTLANNGTAGHRAIRHAVAGFFSPARVRDAERLSRRLNSERLARLRPTLADGRVVDLAGVVAHVPALVLLELLGLDCGDVDVAALKRWSIDSLELFWGWPDPVEQQRLAASAAQFYAWLRERTAAARATPTDDVFGRLVGLGLSDEEVCGATYFLLIAGHETTSQLVAAAFHRLLADPGRWAAVGRDPGLAGPAVEEVLASASSVPTWRRRAVRETRLGGVGVPAGAALLLRLTGAGGPGDLAFGVGVHRCLGAALARMEARVAVEEATSLGRLERTEPAPPMVDLLSFRAPRRVLVVAPGRW